MEWRQGRRQWQGGPVADAGAQVLEDIAGAVAQSLAHAQVHERSPETCGFSGAARGLEEGSKNLIHKRFDRGIAGCRVRTADLDHIG